MCVTAFRVPSQEYVTNRRWHHFPPTFIFVIANQPTWWTMDACCCCSSDECAGSGHPAFPKSRISSISGYDVQRLLFKIRRAKSFLPSIQSIRTLDWRNSTHSSTAPPAKHIGQIESIVAHMQHNGLLPLPLDKNSEKYESCTLKSSVQHDAQQPSSQNSTNKTSVKKVFYFVEFGCGTAKLSDHVSMHIQQQQQQQQQQKLQHQHQHQPLLHPPETQQYHFILIDRQPMKAVERYCDGRIRARSSPFQSSTIVQRFTCPISEIRLSEIINDTMSLETTKRVDVVVAMSKHLCGSATDDAIQCLQDYQHDFGCNSLKANLIQPLQQPGSSTTNPIPLIIATCCHYACHPSTFLKSSVHHGTSEATVDSCKKSLAELSYLQFLGFDHRDIEVIIIVSQWASIKVDRQFSQDEQSTAMYIDSGMTAPAKSTAAELFPPELPVDPISMDIPVDDEWIPSDLFEKTFTRQEKYHLGQYSKIILDTARAYDLQHRCGYTNVKLVHFTTLSLERNLIVATM
jgi:Methyltransferase TRM13